MISKKSLWAGRIVSALPILLFLMNITMVVTKAPAVAEGTAHLGYPPNMPPIFAALQLVCAAIYLYPRTSILGAILLTGYLGGATASHVRIGEPFLIPIVVGVMVWLGLYLRDDRLRALVPLRSN